MKTKGTNREVVQAFMTGTGPTEAHAMHWEGDKVDAVLFSYATPVARRVGVRGVLLVSRERYSTTTRMQLGLVRQHANLPIIEVEHVARGGRSAYYFNPLKEWEYYGVLILNLSNEMRAARRGTFAQEARARRLDQLQAMRQRLVQAFGPEIDLGVDL